MYSAASVFWSTMNTFLASAGKTPGLRHGSRRSFLRLRAWRNSYPANGTTSHHVSQQLPQERRTTPPPANTTIIEFWKLSRLSQTSSSTGHGRRILLLAKLSSATMRLLPFLLAFTTSVLAYPQISSPAAGSSIPAGTITVKWTDNGDAPSISQLQTYTMTLFAGGNNAGVDSVSTPVIGLGLSKTRWSMSAGG